MNKLIYIIAMTTSMVLQVASAYPARNGPGEAPSSASCKDIPFPVVSLAGPTTLDVVLLVALILGSTSVVTAILSDHREAWKLVNYLES